MSDDLISRQAAIDAMKNMYRAAEKWGFEASDDVIKARAESCMASLFEMKLRIENLPSAQERKKGRWKPFDLTWGRSIYFCTACNDATEVPTSYDKPVYKYCPWCGADMRGEEDG